MQKTEPCFQCIEVMWTLWFIGCPIFHKLIATNYFRKKIVCRKLFYFLLVLLQRHTLIKRCSKSKVVNYGGGSALRSRLNGNYSKPEMDGYFSCPVPKLHPREGFMSIKWIVTSLFSLIILFIWERKVTVIKLAV